MTAFVLQPCRVRDDRIVVTRDPPQKYEWNDALDKLAPIKDNLAKTRLKSARAGSYVGKIHHSKTGELVNFMLMTPDTTGKIDWLLSKDPKFAERLVDIYRVEDVQDDGRIERLGVVEGRKNKR